MHIPDGFLDPLTVIITFAVFFGYGFYVLREIRRTSAYHRISLISVLAATIFAAQMLNWPIPGGTSLHFVGGALAGIMLGPSFGFLTMFLVLFIQCLVFHDGGLTALGANVLNMAIIDVLVGYLVYHGFSKMFQGKKSLQAIPAFLGGWIGIIVAGIACGLEIGYSPLFPYGFAITVPVMAGWHAVLGIIEGLITASVVVYVHHKAPYLIFSEEGSQS